MPEDVKEQALKELSRLERMGEQTGESSMIRTYLDWLIAVPWGKRSEEHLDPVAARAVLDADHAGLEDVKDRVTEYLAVRKLRQDRGIEVDPKSGCDPDADRAARAPARHRSASRSRGQPDASSCGCRWAASATRPRSAGTGAPISARCQDVWSGRSGRGHDEPGDPARRGRQGRRGLARGPLRGAARGP